MTNPLPQDERRILVHPPALLPSQEEIEPGSETVVSTSLAGAVEVFERRLIEDALKTSRGNRSRAARLLGTTERVIGYKVRKYRIDPERLRE